MKHYLSTTSLVSRFFQPIRAPEGETGSGGGDGGTGGAGGASHSQGEGEPAGGSGGGFTDPFLREYEELHRGDDDDDDGFVGSAEMNQQVDDLLAAFAEDGEGEGAGAGPDGVDPQKNQNEAKALGEELKAAITGMALPDEFFDQDFDAGDSQAVRGAMQKAVQYGVQQALGLSLKATDLAVRQTRDMTMANMRAEMKNSQSASATQSRLQQLVPALGNAESSKVLEPMRAKLESNGKSVEQQAKALNQIAQMLGLNKRAKAGSGNSGNRGNRESSGTSALDALFGK